MIEFESGTSKTYPVYSPTSIPHAPRYNLPIHMLIQIKYITYNYIYIYDSVVIKTNVSNPGIGSMRILTSLMWGVDPYVDQGLASIYKAA